MRESSRSPSASRQTTLESELIRRCDDAVDGESAPSRCSVMTRRRSLSFRQIEGQKRLARSGPTWFRYRIWRYPLVHRSPMRVRTGVFREHPMDSGVAPRAGDRRTGNEDGSDAGPLPYEMVRIRLQSSRTGRRREANPILTSGRIHDARAARRKARGRAVRSLGSRMSTLRDDRRQESLRGWQPSESHLRDHDGGGAAALIGETRHARVPRPAGEHVRRQGSGRALAIRGCEECLAFLTVRGAMHGSPLRAHRQLC